MSKELRPLEALNKIKSHMTVDIGFVDVEKCSPLYNKYFCEKELNIVEDTLKSFEIIKQEVIEFGYTHLDRLLEAKTYQDYINCINEEIMEHYSKEQFDLLKEVLK